MASHDEYALRGMQAELQELDQRRSQLVREMDWLSQRSGIRIPSGAPRFAAATMTPDAPAKQKRNLTPEGRQRLADAQKARWAAKRQQQAAPEPARSPMPRHNRKPASSAQASEPEKTAEE